VPADILPELQKLARDFRASPRERVGLVLQKEIRADELDSAFRDGRLQHLVLHEDVGGAHAESGRNRRACDVAVQNRRPVALLVHLGRQKRRDERLSDTALSAHDGYHFLHRASLAE